QGARGAATAVPGAPAGTDHRAASHRATAISAHPMTTAHASRPSGPNDCDVATTSAPSGTASSNVASRPKLNLATRNASAGAIPSVATTNAGVSACAKVSTSSVAI